ncbi:MAG: ImmA/IrrE family metallo-endopeptidase [Sideroxyarcus sp.]|nr:ImmA/IrrE family metallo-endopeptidase [Sideroxyarcus sp.]
MIRSLSERITESRRLLENQYAYLDDLGGYSALPHHDELKEASSEEITRSRRLLRNPYAHSDESGGFSALSNHSHEQVGTFAAAPQKITKECRHSHIEIERQVRNLHKRIWQNRNKIWLNTIPSNPIDMLDPIIALNLIGYDCDLDETLGQFYSDGKLIEVAGAIDKSSAKVRISGRFENNIRNFTAAHELGHALLHQTSGLHRDRPLNGATISRDPIELEADKFATSFLMPRKLVKTTFENFFLTDKFFLNEETAFALGYGDFMELKGKVKALRQLSKMLASAEQYNGRHFISLANQFRVSTEAMAIRLEELELLAL